MLCTVECCTLWGPVGWHEIARKNRFVSLVLLHSETEYFVCETKCYDAKNSEKLWTFFKNRENKLKNKFFWTLEFDRNTLYTVGNIRNMLLKPHPLFRMLLQPHHLLIRLLQPHPLFLMLLQTHPLLSYVATVQPHPLLLMLCQPHLQFLWLLQPYHIFHMLLQPLLYYLCCYILVLYYFILLKLHPLLLYLCCYNLIFYSLCCHKLILDSLSWYNLILCSLFCYNLILYHSMLLQPEMGTHSWFWVLALPRSWHFRNGGAREHKFYTGTWERGTWKNRNTKE